MVQLIERANSWTAGLSMHSSVHFMMANATISLGSMLSTYPGPLSLVTVQVQLGVLVRALLRMPVVPITGSL